MTDLEIMQRAKEYIDMLANGIDPITGAEAPEDDIINNVRLSRCFFYVSSVLQKVIDNGGTVSVAMHSSKKLSYTLPLETRAQFRLSDRPVTVSVIAQQLNELVNLETMQKLKVTSISAFLMQSGLIEAQELPSGQTIKRPTDSGRSLGISTEQRTGQLGDYTVVVYDRSAQQFILDNLDAIIAINVAPLHENQGKPWTSEEDAYLRNAYKAGNDLKSLSAELKRSRAAIRTRLRMYGLEDRGDQIDRKPR